MNNFHRNVAIMMYNTQCLPENFEQCSLEKPPGAMLPYGGMVYMPCFWGLKFHSRAIFFGFKICKHELPILRREFSATTIFSKFSYVTPLK